VICATCRHANRDEARFCDGCGAKLACTCTSCGTELRAGARFCDGCGAPLGAAAAPPPAPSRDPRAYTPKHLADKILQSRSALEGERKQVTVLFADVKGSMELAESVDPEQWHAILDRFFAILAEGVHRFEGTVNQYTGDGIMALFGAPIAHEDHAQRACFAALALRDELRRYAEELRLERGIDFSVRMGLNSGEVVVGKIGDDLRMDYTAQGQTVGLAQRMEQLAGADRICVAEETARRVEGYFALRALGPARVKGVSGELRAFELEGVGALRTRFDLSRARGLTRFVGRVDETAALEAALARAQAGEPQVIGIVAEAGTGKSRICFEFLERCRARGIASYSAHGVSHGKSIPFLPMIELFRDYFGIADGDSPVRAREKIAGRLVLLDESLRDALPVVFDFLGVADSEQPAPTQDADARQRLLVGVMRRVSELRGRRETTVTLLEDLHWFDAASDTLLASLVDTREGTRRLLLANFRPEYRAAWMEKSFYQQLPLRPLGAEAVDELLRELVGTDASLGPFIALARERTGGNPFFVEELVLSLAESGALAGARGAYRLTRPVREIAVPATVQSILAARVDRLSEREKQVLQTASVIGREFGQALLGRVIELPERELADALRALLSAEFLLEASLYPTPEFAFKHALTRDVAYGSMLSERRARLHGAVARALEGQVAAADDERAALLAHHYDAAGLALEAARWHRRAADWSMRSDFSEGRRHAERVRALVATLPESAERRELALAACSQLLGLGSRLGISSEEETALLAQGRALASGDPRALGGLLSVYARLRLTSGDVRGQIAVGQELLALADAESDPVLRVVAQITLMLAHNAHGPLGEVIRLADEILSVSPEIRDRGLAEARSSLALLFAIRGNALSFSGNFALGAREFERSLALTREQSGSDQWSVHTLIAAAAESQGDAATLATHARHALALAERTGAPGLESGPRSWIGVGHALAGRIDEAVAAHESALDVVRATQTFLQLEAMLLVHLAETELLRAGSERACALSREAVDAAERAGIRWFKAKAHGVLARSLLHRHGTSARAEVEDEIAHCERLIRETGARAELPFLHTVRAELARVLGDESARTGELREAHRLCVEMGATGRAERLAKELAT
jgi:class 3 adenylate cyclase/tetratricopeptide (TPR) repeat protein